MSLRDQILSASDAPTTAVQVTEWATTIHLRTMSGTDRESWEVSAFKDGKADMTHFRAKLLARCIVDDKGARVFTDDDIPALSAKSGPVLVRLYDTAAKMNGLTKADVAELTKN
jgi:hypothetical protein